MAMHALTSDIFVPDIPAFPIVVGGATANSVAGEKNAQVLQAAETMVVTAISFKVNALTTAGNVDVSIQTLDPATGSPTGTLWSAGAEALAFPLTTANTIYTATLTTPVTINRGDIYVIVLTNPATSNPNYALATQGSSARLTTTFPYRIRSTSAGVWTKAVNAPFVVVPVVSGAYPFMLHGGLVHNFTAESFNSGTASGSGGDERGVMFNLPYGVRVTGAWIFEPGGPFELVLYDAADNVLMTSQTFPNAARATAGSGTVGVYMFNGTYDTLPNVTYRLAIKPTSTTNVSIRANTATTGYTADMQLSSLPFSAAQFTWTSRTDGGAWTQNNLKVPFLTLVCRAIDTGGGGGSGPSPFAYGFSG